MKKTKMALLLLTIATVFLSCKKDKEVTPPESANPEPKLVFRFIFDSTQVRLDNQGNPSALPANHGAQSPRFNTMSAHYIEMTSTPYTGLGAGTVLYHAPETNAGGTTAIDFSQSKQAANNEIFYSIPLKDVAAGTFQWLRVSLAYQNYDIDLRYNWNGINLDLTGTLASFIGYNTFINSFQIKDSTVYVNANRAQGFWAFETIYGTQQGQAPQGSTTVPNPLFTTSPIPAGSCVVTGGFETPLIITGNEQEDIIVNVSLSTNNSFEWIENSTPGYFEPAAGDAVVDMGIRGMEVSHQ